MNTHWAFQCLQLANDAGTREIRRRYSELLKLNRPEDNPEGFQQLRAAYELCLAVARAREQDTAEAESVAVIEPEPAAFPAPAATAEQPPLSAARTRSTVELPAWQHVHNDTPQALRPPMAVVDELITVSHRTADAFAEWLAHCPELVGLHTRDAVERELLQRILDGSRIGADALLQLSAAFGWRQVGFERRLREQGLPPARLAELQQVLLRTQAEAEFEAHLRAGKVLGEESNWTTPATQEIAQLRWLHAQRDREIPLWRALPLGTVSRYHSLIQRYGQRYGARSALHIFGHESLAFWSRLHPAHGISWPQYALRLGQLSLIVLAAYLALLLLLAFVSNAPDPQERLRAIGQWTRICLLGLWPAGIGVVSAVAALRAFRHHHAAIERLRRKWLAPQPALTALAILAPLLVLGQIVFGWQAMAVVTVLLCGLMGWNALIYSPVLGAGVGAIAYLMKPDVMEPNPWLPGITLFAAWLLFRYARDADL